MTTKPDRIYQSVLELLEQTTASDPLTPTAISQPFSRIVDHLLQTQLIDPQTAAYLLS